MEKELKKQVDAAISSGNYLQASNLLMPKFMDVMSDVETAEAFINCIIHGALNAGENKKVIQIFNELETDGQGTAKDGFFMKLLMKKVDKKSANLVYDNKPAILKLTNSYLLTALQGVLTAGDSDAIERVANQIETLYGPINVLVSSKLFITYKTYNVIGELMCAVGKIMIDAIKATGKKDYPGCKVLVGGFQEKVVVPLIKFISGFVGLLNGSSIPQKIRADIKRLNADLLSLK